MEDLVFRRDDIKNLAKKLSKVKLDADEQKLLLAIFAAAAERVRPARKDGKARIRAAQISEPPQASTRKQTAPKDLCDQLLYAYAPGKDLESATCPNKIF